MAVCVIWHENNSADWLAALASPFPTAPDFHLKVKRLTMICASLMLLHPLLSLTHWIFRSLMLPYKSSSHSANHVRCASLRSGGRRLAVRKTIEYQIGALPRTPFPAAREFPSRGNEGYEEKNRGVICFMYYSSISPFGGWRHHLARWEACHLILSRLRLLANQVPLPPLRGGTMDA